MTGPAFCPATVRCRAVRQGCDLRCAASRGADSEAKSTSRTHSPAKPHHRCPKLQKENCCSFGRPLDAMLISRTLSTAKLSLIGRPCAPLTKDARSGTDELSHFEPEMGQLEVC